VAQDDWRLRIELDHESAGGLLARLGVLSSEADEVARDLAEERLAVTRDGATIFVYASSSLQLEQAEKLIQAELAKLSVTPERTVREHWLAKEDRWDDESAPETVERETLAAGYAPWEVRVPCPSHHAARELADRLEAEGYSVVRRWSYVIAGTASEAEAQELANRLHGEAEPGGELVWEVVPGNPFAVFGGLGSTGTPF
jgi:hypothetical protein